MKIDNFDGSFLNENENPKKRGRSNPIASGTIKISAGDSIGGLLGTIFGEMMSEDSDTTSFDQDGIPSLVIGAGPIMNKKSNDDTLNQLEEAISKTSDENLKRIYRILVNELKSRGLM